MISIVRNNIIIMGPQACPDTWTDPDSGIQWSNFKNMPLVDMDALGRKDVIDNPLNYDPLYEQFSVSDWRYDAGLDVVTRDHTITDRPIEEVRAERLEAVRLECKDRIMAVISLEHQMDIALGIDPDLGYSDWIADMRAESNRCEDLYAAAATMDDIKAVAWNFPAYTGGV